MSFYTDLLNEAKEAKEAKSLTNEVKKEKVWRDELRRGFQSDLFKNYIKNRVKNDEPLIIWRNKFCPDHYLYEFDSDIMAWGKQILEEELGFPNVTYYFDELDEEWFFNLIV